MTNTPMLHDPRAPIRPLPPGERGLRDDLRLGEIWSALVRHRWIVAAFAALGGAAGATYGLRTMPTYQSAATIRIQERQLDLSAVYRSVSAGIPASDLATEMEVLGSRALREAAASTLGLQVYLIAPERVSRQEIISGVTVDSTAVFTSYRLVRTPDKRFRITLADSGRQVGMTEADGTFRQPGVSFKLLPRALDFAELVIGVQSFTSAVDGLSSGVTVSQPRRDAYIVTLAFATTDSLLARDVPNAITAQYLERRQSNKTEDARNSVKFLKEQLGRVSTELQVAEESFRSFKETRQVLDPQVQTSSEVGRLVTKESERSSVEAERAALAKSLAGIEGTDASDADNAARYQQLAGLPFFLKNTAASTLLSTLMTAQAERAALVGRTARDPDAEVLDAKIRDLRGQLYSITNTYLEGLGNQVTSLNQQLTHFQRQLDSIPSKELQFGRLDRRVKALEEVYALLQGRLQEAEIAEASKDVSVQVVDTAEAPDGPSSPNVPLNTMVALALGLLLGLVAAGIREYRDNSVHTRHDIVIATGVPVLGLIPRMSRSNGRVALIAERARPGTAVSVRHKPANKGVQYAFVKPSPGTDGRTGDPVIGSVGQLAISDWGRGVAEAYGLLQTNLAFAHSGPPIKVVVVTSPLAEDGKTTCATNLAITLALRGSNTLLIDADLRRGVVHMPFGVGRAPGLSEALRSPARAAEFIRSVRVGPESRELHFLTTGDLPANPSGLLESGFPALLEGLRDQFDSIVIDSPPVNIISDASLLGLQADGVLVVARSGVTQSSALSYATEQLARVGVPLLGVVLNDIDFKREAGYDSSYRSYASNPYVKASQGSQG